MKAIDRRLRALETVRSGHVAAANYPRWFIEAEKDRTVWKLLRQAAAHDDAAAIAVLHERFGAEADQMIEEYGEVWRRLDAEC
nr:hypothetical protein [Alcaligenes faecalis]